MEARKLTPEQIDDLFAFCEEQDVPYYDVQIELVDHLANAIEQKWINKPNLPYEKALWAIFDQFGPSGFRKIRKSKEKELRKKYNRMLWQYIGEFYKLPKIILTFALTLSLFVFFRMWENNLDTFLLLLFPFLIFMIVLQILQNKRSKIQLIPGRSFLLYDHLMWIKSSLNTSYHVPTVSLIFYIEYLKKTNFYNGHNLYFEFAIACFIAFFLVFLVGMNLYLPKRIKTDFIREYPQFVKD
jgi:hypothetical protein